MQDLGERRSPYKSKPEPITWHVFETKKEALSFVSSKLKGEDRVSFDVDDTLVESFGHGDTDYGMKLYKICKEQNADIYYVTARTDNKVVRDQTKSLLKSRLGPDAVRDEKLLMHTNKYKQAYGAQKYVHRKTISEDGSKKLVAVGDRITDIMSNNSIMRLHKMLLKKDARDFTDAAIKLHSVFDRLGAVYIVFENCDKRTRLGVLVPTGNPCVST